MALESEKPLRLLINPFTIWTELAFKTGEALWATAHAAAVQASAPKVAVIPTEDEGMAAAHAAPLRKANDSVLPARETPRKARAAPRRASKAVRFKATRAKLRSKANARRRARR